MAFGQNLNWEMGLIPPKVSCDGVSLGGKDGLGEAWRMPSPIQYLGADPDLELGGGRGGGFVLLALSASFFFRDCFLYPK